MSQNSLGGFTRADCQNLQFDCLPMLATDRTETDTEFAVSCGDVMFKFTMTLTSLQLFREAINTSNGAAQMAGLINRLVRSAQARTSCLPASSRAFPRAGGLTVRR